MIYAVAMARWSRAERPLVSNEPGRCCGVKEGSDPVPTTCRDSLRRPCSQLCAALDETVSTWAKTDWDVPFLSRSFVSSSALTYGGRSRIPRAVVLRVISPFAWRIPSSRAVLGHLNNGLRFFADFMVYRAHLACVVILTPMPVAAFPDRPWPQREAYSRSKRGPRKPGASPPQVT